LEVPKVLSCRGAVCTLVQDHRKHSCVAREWQVLPQSSGVVVDQPYRAAVDALGALHVVRVCRPGASI
jgi:hypothetical protein